MADNTAAPQGSGWNSLPSPILKQRLIGSQWWPARKDGKPCTSCGLDNHYGGRCSLPWNDPLYWVHMEDGHPVKDRLCVEYFARELDYAEEREDRDRAEWLTEDDA